MPVDPEEYIAMYPEVLLSDAEREAWLNTRSGAVAGRQIADRFGWKIGDRLEQLKDAKQRAEALGFPIQGLADHTISRSLYLRDPDGNEVELYVDDPDYPDCTQWLDSFPRLIVTRTFSKIYGLAGLRIGYGVSSPELASVIQRVRHPFNANLIALAAAEAALDDEQFLLQSRNVNSAGMQQLMSGFDDMGLKVIPSVANFLTVDLEREAAPVNQALLEQGVIVRPVANYKMPNHLRITIGSEKENQTFLAAFGKAMSA